MQQRKMPQIVRTFTNDKLVTKIYRTRGEMGLAAASATAGIIKEVLEKKATVNIVFAAARSQLDFLQALCTMPDIDWSRVVAMHMDDYLGLPADAPQGFGTWLKNRAFSKVQPGKVFYMRECGEDARQLCERYSALLREYPVDITCLGIGENGHIAFNDPPAVFEDPLSVKVVELDTRCRQQQVNDGEFESIDQVPKQAITLTVPAIMASRWIIGIVPGASKSEAVFNTLNGDITEKCPASILREHANACLYIDEDAARMIP